MRIIMRKTLIALGVLITANTAPAQVPTIAHTQQEIPAYAKWGK